MSSPMMSLLTSPAPKFAAGFASVHHSRRQTTTILFQSSVSSIRQVPSDRYLGVAPLAVAALGVRELRGGGRAKVEQEKKEHALTLSLENAQESSCTRLVFVTVPLACITSEYTRKDSGTEYGIHPRVVPLQGGCRWRRGDHSRSR